MKKKVSASKKTVAANKSTGKKNVNSKVASKNSSPKPKAEEKSSRNLMMEDPFKTVGVSAKKKNTTSKAEVKKIIAKSDSINPFAIEKNKTEIKAKTVVAKKPIAKAETKAKVKAKVKPKVKASPVKKPTPIKKEKAIKTEAFPEKEAAVKTAPKIEEVPIKEEPVQAKEKATEIPKRETEKVTSVAIDRITRANGSQFKFDNEGFNWLKEAQGNYMRMFEKQMSMYQSLLNAMPGGNQLLNHPANNMMESLMQANPFGKALYDLINTYKK